MATKKFEDAVKTITKPLAGLSARNCKKARDLIKFAAKGPKRGWWTSGDEFKAEAAADRRFAGIVGEPDWEAITEMIIAIIEAIAMTK